MRQIVLDTETTGLEPSEGHRIIEIGCVELINRRPSSNRYQQYINPGREIDAGAIEVHGITNEILADKPKFADIANDFLEFVKGAELDHPQRAVRRRLHQQRTGADERQRDKRPPASRIIAPSLTR